MAITLHPSIFVHVGIWLRKEIIEPHGLTVTQAAERLKVSRPAMSDLLNGKQGISARLADRFERVFGIKAETLLRMQVAYELAQVRLQPDGVEVERLAA
jgi:antitoxin HigA-1